MKYSKIKKQQRKIFLLAICFMLIAATAFYTVFAAITIGNAKQILLKQANTRAVNLQNRLRSCDKYDDYSNGILNTIQAFSGSNTRLEYRFTPQIGTEPRTEKAISRSTELQTDQATELLSSADYFLMTFTFDYESNIDANKQTFLSKNAILKSSISINGAVNYDKFRKSISDEDFDEIVKYLVDYNNYYGLEDVSDENGEYVEVFCSKAIVDARGEIYPLELVLINSEDNIAYKTFTLNVENVDELKASGGIELIGSDNTNIITLEEMQKTYTGSGNDDMCVVAYESDDADFSLYTGDVEYMMITDEDVKAASSRFGNTDNIENDTDYRVHNSGIFTSVYYKQISADHKSGSLSDSLIDYDAFERTNTTYQSTGYEVYYYQKINAWILCGNTLVFDLIYTILVSLGIGVILSIVICCTTKKQMVAEMRAIELSNSMAHDLKTPIFVVSGYAENLIENIRTDKREHYAQMIKQKAEEMDDIVHNMLEITKVADDKFTLEKESFDLEELVKEVINQYDDNIKEKIRLYSSDSNSQITADKGYMSIVLQNLINNAIKYSTDGNIKIELENNKFKISNQSVPFKRSELKKLWKPYYMGKDNPRTDGNGLGLAIADNILNAHKFKHNSDYSDKTFTVWFSF